MPSPPYSANWNTLDGDWFAAGNWNETDPVTNLPVHYVPGVNNSVTLGASSAFAVSYNGVDEIWSLGGSNATLNINGGSLTVDHDSYLEGVINLAAGTKLAAAENATLTFRGGSISGTLGGAGTIQFHYGSFSLKAGTVLSVANLILGVTGNGAVSTTTLETDLTYAGNFTQVDYSGNQALLRLNGHTLTLTGAATLDGTITGPGKVIVSGQVTEPTGYGGNTVVGGATLEAASGATITQNGNVFLGDQTTKGTLQVDAGATYKISTIGNINSGGDSLFVNNGHLIDEAAGATASWISGGFTNNGQLTIAAGATLNFAFPGVGVETFGGTIDGGGTLSFSNGVNAVINTASITVANWRITDGKTKLGVDLTYGGVFDFSAAFGVLDLGGHTLTLTGLSDTLAAPYGAIKGGGKLKIAGAATFNGLSIGDGDVATTVEVAGSVTQTSDLSLNGTLQIDLGATYKITNASAIGATSAGALTTINKGTLIDQAVGTSEIRGAFTNTGALSIASGATLKFSGVETFGGSISGAGTLTIGFAAQATINTANVTVANIYINGGNGGGTTKLGVDLAYAGNFTFANQFGTLDLNGHTLTLSGVSSLSGQNVAGPGKIKITGSSTIGSLTVGGNGAAAATIEDAGTITQNNPLTLNGSLLIDAGALYKIVAAPYGGGISNGGSATITNNGTFAVQAAEPATIQGTFVNNGALAISAGATAIFSGVETFGGSISGAGTLALGAGAQATINTTNVTVANITISGTTKLGVDLAYAGNFTFANQFGTLDLNGHKLTLSGVSAFSGANVAGPGLLKITGSSTIGGLWLGSGTSAPTLEVAGAVKQNNPVTFYGALVVDATGVWNIITDSTLTLSGAGSIANSGLFEKTAGTGVSDLWLNGLSFTNAGTVLAKSGTLRIHGSLANSGLAKADGATLIIDGALTGAGSASIDHQGVLQIGGAVAAGEEIKFLSAAGAETLDLGTPAGFAGTLDGFGDGDLLRLHGVNATAAAVVGSALRVTAAGGAHYDLALANIHAGYFTIDVHDGESDVRLTTGGDTVNGVAGDDIIIGGSGVDIFNGNGGNDTLKGGAGKDVLDGGAGVDTADYSDKTASVVVTLNGAANATVNVGGVAEDTIRNIENVTGGSGADTFVGNSAANTLFGGAGNDVLKGGAGKDVLDGGAGVDTASYLDKTASVVVTLNGATNATVSVGGVAEDTIRNIENIRGGSGNDTIVGDNLANTLSGNDGKDLLKGGGGKDVLDGGAGVDTASYLDKTTSVVVTLNGSANATVTVGGVAEDTIRNIENISGGSGNDTISGDSLANTLLGNAGNDVLRGGGGADFLDGGAGVDTADYSDKTSSVVATLNGANNAVVKVGGVAEDTIRNIENLIGGSGADTLTGDNSANLLWGGAGADLLRGGGGADAFVFTPSFGKDRVADFTASDTLRIDHALFADWGTLLAHTSQVGANTVITVNASNTITLENFAVGNLTQSQVTFT